jgi:hypothetical protein
MYQQTLKVRLGGRETERAMRRLRGYLLPDTESKIMLALSREEIGVGKLQR